MNAFEEFILQKECSRSARLCFCGPPCHLGGPNDFFRIIFYEMFQTAKAFRL